MEYDNLIEKVEYNCPICNKVHLIEKRVRETQALLNNEVVNYEQTYFACFDTDEEDNEFVPAKLMNTNMLKVRDAYRQMKGLLTSFEIRMIREYYGLTQSDFALLLGWGEVTITRYESKTIQDETYDHIMRLAYDNPKFVLDSLIKHKDRIEPEKHKTIYEKVKERIIERGNYYLKKQEIENQYIMFDHEVIENGFRMLNIEKVSDVISFFASATTQLYKVKLMKLLWYADVIFFGRHGKSMTGLVYKHMPLGALPIAFDEIIYNPKVTVVEELINDEIAYRICPKYPKANYNLTEDELSVLQIVVEKFKTYRTKEIVEYMHEEKAYKMTKSGEVIPYSLAKELNELC